MQVHQMSANAWLFLCRQFQRLSTAYSASGDDIKIDLIQDDDDRSRTGVDCHGCASSRVMAIQKLGVFESHVGMQGMIAAVVQIRLERHVHI